MPPLPDRPQETRPACADALRAIAFHDLSGASRATADRLTHEHDQAVQDEREACAAIADQYEGWDTSGRHVSSRIATRIRARSTASHAPE